MLQDLENRQGEDELNADYQPSASVKRTRNLWIIISLILAVMVMYFSVRAIGVEKIQQEWDALMVTLGWQQPEPEKKQAVVSVNQAMEQIMPARQPQPEVAEAKTADVLAEPETIALADVVSDEMADALQRSSQSAPSDNKATSALVDDPVEAVALIPEKADAPEVLPAEPAQADAEPVFSVSVSDATPQERIAHLKQLARDALDTGREGRALDALTEVLQMAPEDVKVRQKLAALEFGQGNIQRTMALLQEGLVVAPQAYGFRLMLARLYFQQQQGQRALELLNGAVPEIEQYVDYYGFHASLAQQLQQDQRAQSLYQKLASFEPHRAKWWLGLGISLDRQSQFAPALEAYSRAAELQQLSNASQAFVRQRIAELGG